MILRASSEALNRTRIDYSYGRFRSVYLFFFFGQLIGDLSDKFCWY